MIKQKKILELLLKKGLVSSEQAVAILAEAKSGEKKIEDLLLEKKIFISYFMRLFNRLCGVFYFGYPRFVLLFFETLPAFLRFSSIYYRNRY